MLQELPHYRWALCENVPMQLQRLLHFNARARPSSFSRALALGPQTCHRFSCCAKCSASPLERKAFKQWALRLVALPTDSSMFDRYATLALQEAPQWLAPLQKEVQSPQPRQPLAVSRQVPRAPPLGSLAMEAVLPRAPQASFALLAGTDGQINRVEVLPPAPPQVISGR